jgi:hypothetical protein
MDLNVVVQIKGSTASGGSEPGRDETTKVEITFLVEFFGHEEFNGVALARLSPNSLMLTPRSEESHFSAS